MERLSTSLLWIDCTGGLIAGILMLSFSEWLSALHVLPIGLIVTMGVANVVYGTFSFSLARRALRPPKLLLLLVVANSLWAVLCAVTAVVVAADASIFGISHLALESVYVGGLGALQWRYRNSLFTAP